MHPFLKNFNQWLGRNAHDYVKSVEETDGLFHIHYAVFFGGEGFIARLREYVVERHLRLFMDEPVDESRVRIELAQDTG